MDDETKQLIRNHLCLQEHTIWCVHNKNRACIICKTNITGDLSNVRGNITGIIGDLSNVRGNLSNIRGDLSNISGDLTGVCGNLSNISGDLTGVCGDLSGISGDLTGIRATAGEIKEVLREIEWEKEL